MLWGTVGYYGVQRAAVGKNAPGRFSVWATDGGGGSRLVVSDWSWLVASGGALLAGALVCVVQAVVRRSK